MPQIPHRHKKGEELPQDGGQCGAEHPQKGREEGLPDHKVEHARPGHQQNAVARQPGGLVRFPFAQVKGESRGAADAQQQ